VCYHTDVRVTLHRLLCSNLYTYDLQCGLFSILATDQLHLSLLANGQDTIDISGPDLLRWIAANIFRLTETRNAKKKRLFRLIGLVLCASTYIRAQDVVSAVSGTVKKVDATTRVVVVKTTDGTEHTFHYPSDVTVHGRKDIDVASKNTLHGLTEGSEVAVHYSVDGTKETAHEIDSIGKDGLKTTKGLVSHVDGGAQEISIKAEDGNELTFRLTDRAAKDTSRAIVAGTDKSAKVTVYYTEKEGKKTAHFIKAAF
jgi:hypothetical protein